MDPFSRTESEECFVAGNEELGGDRQGRGKDQIVFGMRRNPVDLARQDGIQGNIPDTIDRRPPFLFGKACRKIRLLQGARRIGSDNATATSPRRI